MARWFPVFMLCLGMIAPGRAGAQVFRATGNELFCRDKSNFPEYMAVLHNKQFTYHTVAGCTELKKGMRYRVIEEHPESGINKVRLITRHGAIDGYILTGG